MKRLMFILLFLTSYLPLTYTQPLFAQDVKGKKLFAYAGGVGEVDKIDMETLAIVKRQNDKRLGINPTLQINAEGNKLYVTGELFSVPLIVIDPKTLKIIKTLSGVGLEDVRGRGVYYACNGKLSPDGRRIALDCKFGPTPFALIDTATLKTINRRREFRSDPLSDTIFSDNSKLLYVLTRLQEKQGKTIYETKIIILDAERGGILKEIRLPDLKRIKCSTNISAFSGETSNIYITWNCNFASVWGPRGFLKEDELYPSIEPGNTKIIKLITVKSGEVIETIPLPNGRGDLNEITVTPDGKRLLIGRGGYRHPGELTIVDIESKKVIKRIMLEGGATSNVVFGYE